MSSRLLQVVGWPAPADPVGAGFLRWSQVLTVVDTVDCVYVSARVQWWGEMPDEARKYAWERLERLADPSERRRLMQGPRLAAARDFVARACMRMDSAQVVWDADSVEQVREALQRASWEGVALAGVWEFDQYMAEYDRTARPVGLPPRSPIVGYGRAGV